MAALELKAQPRSVIGRQVKQLRAQGMVPAVVYGHDVPSRAIQIGAQEMERTLRRAGFTQLINLHIEKGSDSGGEMVLVREVQRHPVRRDLLHVDFYRVVMTEKLRAEVPVHLVGEAPAVTQGAILVHNLNTIEVECLPADIPEFVTADLSSLTDASQSITVAQLRVPGGVEVVSDPDEVVVSVVFARAVTVEEEAAAAAEAVPAEPEVVSKGKAAREEEGEE
jgi:large subunit ribosomal protein L25